MWFLSPRAFRRAATAHRRRPCRPRVEMLEDRCQPSAGVPDPTFGTGGVVTPAITADSVLVQPWDSKIVLAGSAGGDMSVARYNPNGTLDTTFGSGGIEVSTFAGGGVAAQYPESGMANDGKIVELGSGDTLVRFNANGSVDTTFGKNGVATLPAGAGSIGDLVIQPDGKIVASGIVGGSAASVKVIRLNANGSVDTSFGTQGTYSRSIALNTYQTKSLGYVALQANGELLVTEPYGAAAPGFGWLVFRLTTSGAVDSTFSSQVTGFGMYTGPDGIADPAALDVYSSTGSDTADAGKILAAGYSTGPFKGDGTTVLARYNPNGTLDTSFGNGGKVIGFNSGNSGTVSGVAIQSNGQIIVVGTTMQRYNTNGTLDTTFGSGGVVSAAYSSVAIQPDGRMDAASAAALARYLASEPEIGSFTASANPVPSGSSEALTVSGITDSNPNSSVTQVEFYYIDGSGNQQVLGYGTQTNPGVWTLTFTAGLPAGSYTVYAQAEDSFGVFGDPDALTLQVM